MKKKEEGSGWNGKKRSRGQTGMEKNGGGVR